MVQTVWDTVTALRYENKNNELGVFDLRVRYKKRNKGGGGDYSVFRPGSDAPVVRSKTGFIKAFGYPLHGFGGDTQVSTAANEPARPRALPPTRVPFARPPPGPLPAPFPSPNGSTCCVVIGGKACKKLEHKGWFRHGDEYAGAEHFDGTLHFNEDDWIWVPPPPVPAPSLAPAATPTAETDDALLRVGGTSATAFAPPSPSPPLPPALPPPSARTRARWAEVPLRPGDAPLSALSAFEDHTCFHVWQLGCSGPETTLELIAGDAIVWRGDLLHAGPAWNESQPGPHSRTHTYIHGSEPTPGWRSGLDVCEHDGDDGGGPGFIAILLLPTRAEAVAALQHTRAFDILHAAGYVILPDQSLLSTAAQLEIRSRPSCQNIATGFSAIENGGCTRREAWAGGAWRSSFEAAVTRMLAHYGLLSTALDGPCGGAPKTVTRSAALRSLPGCRRQPPHADFSRQLCYSARPDATPSVPAPPVATLPQPGGLPPARNMPFKKRPLPPDTIATAQHGHQQEQHETTSLLPAPVADTEGAVYKLLKQGPSVPLAELAPAHAPPPAPVPASALPTSTTDGGGRPQSGGPRPTSPGAARRAACDSHLRSLELPPLMPPPQARPLPHPDVLRLQNPARTTVVLRMWEKLLNAIPLTRHSAAPQTLPTPPTDGGGRPQPGGLRPASPEALARAPPPASMPTAALPTSPTDGSGRPQPGGLRPTSPGAARRATSDSRLRCLELPSPLLNAMPPPQQPTAPPGPTHGGTSRYAATHGGAPTYTSGFMTILPEDAPSRPVDAPPVIMVSPRVTASGIRMGSRVADTQNPHYGVGNVVGFVEGSNGYARVCFKQPRKKTVNAPIHQLRLAHGPGP